MKTQTNPILRTVLIFLLFALLLSSCAEKNEGAQATLQAVAKAAQDAIEAQLAAGIVMSSLPPILDGEVYASQVGASLWAIDKAIHGAPNAKIYLQEAQNIALFLSPGARDASGASYWFWGFIDVKTRSLIAVGDQLKLGANIVNCRTMSDFMKAVEEAGFKRVEPSTVPTLVGFLKIAIKYMRQNSTAAMNGVSKLGTSVIEILVVPAGMLTPGKIYPWCQENPARCDGIKQ